MTLARLAPLTLLVFPALLAAGCKHPCEKDGGEIPAAISEAGVVMEGAAACEFGAPTHDEFMNHLAHTKVYHSGDFREVGLKYVAFIEGKGWERVNCEGGLGGTRHDEYTFRECFMKDRKRVRYDAYDFDGTCVDIDLLELKTPEEVQAGAGGGG
ncbi:MAG: hypothetical protein R3B09_03615 [Nannocystaceae bacterium]